MKILRKVKTIMKFLKKLILKRKLKNIGNKMLMIADNAILGGAVSKTIADTKDSPKGKIPYLEILSALIPVILLISLLTGWITIEQLKELLKLF